MMKRFIQQLGEKYGVEITISDTSKLGTRHVFLQSDRVTYLCLFEVNFKDLQELKPIARTIKTLKLVDCEISSFSGLEEFIELEELDLSYSNLEESVNCLKELPKLRKLTIDGIGLEDVKEIGELSHLEYLSMGANEFLHISNTNKFLKLRELHLEDSKILNISDIECCHSLEVLNLSYSDIKNLNGLESFSLLKELNLFHCYIEDMSEIRFASNLEKLNLSYTQVSDLSRLGELLNLKELRCKCTQITSIDNMEELPSLQLLDLSGDSTYWNEEPVLLDSMRGLRHFKSLKKLDLSDQKLSRIEELDGLYNLELLDLKINKLVKLENLPFSSLRGLSLIGNQISELSEPMPKMEELLLQVNNIVSLNSEWLEELMPNCLLDLRNNPIQEVIEVPNNIEMRFGNWHPNHTKLSKW